MLWVWAVSLPVTVLNSPNVTQYPQPAFGTGRDIAGVILFALGFIMESVSDVQKYLFRARQGDKSAICDKGFFSWTRHPNYFGDIIIQFCKPPSTSLNIRASLISHSHLHDCSVSSSKRLRQRPSLQSTLRNYSRALLPHHALHVRLRSHPPRTAWSKEAIREGEQLGRICTLLKPHQYSNPIPTTTIREDAHDPQANDLPRIPNLCF